MADPYPFSIFYSFALMVLCTECWFRRDPWLFNHSPLYLFRAPHGPTKADVPMAPYARVFAAWHAGGVCFCFFMSILAINFPQSAKKETSLALGLLWLTWATTNSWRAMYGGNEFYRVGALFHSLIGGCGVCAFWQLGYWYANTSSLAIGEVVILGVYCAFIVLALVSVTRLRRDAREYLNTAK